jgi:hypothetical protein
MTRPGINEWVAPYVGLSVEDAVALARSEGRYVRVLEPGAYASADFRPDRLNICLDGQGNIERIFAG